MASRIGSIDGSSGVGRIRRRRKGERTQSAAASGPTEEVHAAAEAAPIPPLEPAPLEGPPSISAQLMGQSGPAENADPANAVAQKARSAYLQVEWSGRYDRRTRRGRIAKTDV